MDFIFDIDGASSVSDMTKVNTGECVVYKFESEESDVFNEYKYGAIIEGITLCSKDAKEWSVAVEYKIDGELLNANEIKEVC